MSIAVCSGACGSGGIKRLIKNSGGCDRATAEASCVCVRCVLPVPSVNAPRPGPAKGPRPRHPRPSARPGLAKAPRPAARSRQSPPSPSPYPPPTPSLSPVPQIPVPVPGPAQSAGAQHGQKRPGRSATRPKSGAPPKSPPSAAHTPAARSREQIPWDATHRRRAHVPHPSLSPVPPHKPPSALSRTGVGRGVPGARLGGCVPGVSAGCGGAGVSRVCRLGVARVCRLGVLRECRRRVPGVSRACAGCVAGVSGVCVAGVGRVCRSVPRGPRLPPLPSAPVPSRPRVFSTRVCAPACRSRHTGLRLPLFFFRLRPSPGTSSFPRLIFASPGTSSSFFPRGFTQRRKPYARAAVPLGLLPRGFPRGFKDTQDRRASGFRRAPRTELLFAVLRTRDSKLNTEPHRSTRTSNFHPPAKNTPPPLGDPPHGPEPLPGVHLGVRALGRRSPSCALGCCGPAALSGWFSTAFQTARRQGGASQRRARRCL